MYQYLETEMPGITSASSLTELYQIGWASDGFPIVYKFGPDKDGLVRELSPSFQLRSGERPGDGIVAPCGPYTGKYTVDYEYVEDLGDLDECNGIESEITLDTEFGNETLHFSTFIFHLLLSLPAFAALEPLRSSSVPKNAPVTHF